MQLWVLHVVAASFLLILYPIGPPPPLLFSLCCRGVSQSASFAGIPSLFFYVLYKHRNCLQNILVTQRFGFLYEVSAVAFPASTACC
jgi:hypothetical protein